MTSRGEPLGTGERENKTSKLWGLATDSPKNKCWEKGLFKNEGSFQVGNNAFVILINSVC